MSDDEDRQDIQELGDSALDFRAGGAPLVLCADRPSVQITFAGRAVTTSFD